MREKGKKKKVYSGLEIGSSTTISAFFKFPEMERRREREKKSSLLPSERSEGGGKKSSGKKVKSAVYLDAPVSDNLSAIAKRSIATEEGKDDIRAKPGKREEIEWAYGDLSCCEFPPPSSHWSPS